MSDDKAKELALRYHVLIDYTNHAGVRSVRQIMPQAQGFYFGTTEWHPVPQWLLDAYDVKKDDMRTFAVKDIHRWGIEPDRQMEIDLSIAAQLQRSMELNARMKTRLAKLKTQLRPTDGPLTPRGEAIYILMLETIMRDEEPTWLHA